MSENQTPTPDSAIFAEDAAIQEAVVHPETDAEPAEDFFEPEPPQPRKSRGFRIGFGIFCVLLLAAVIVALWFYQTALAKFESEQEQPPLQAYLELIKSGDYEALYASSGFQATELTGKDTYIAYLKALYADAGELSVVKQVTADSRVQRYHLYSDGDTRLATLLVSGNTDENGKTGWYITTELTYQPDYTVTASEDIDLYINGQPVDLLSADAVSVTEVQSTLLGVTADTASLPVIKSYTLTGLLMPPEIEAAGLNGTDCIRYEQENTLVLMLADDYERSQHEELALATVKAQLSTDTAASATLTVESYGRYSEGDFSCTVRCTAAEGEPVTYDTVFLRSADDTWTLGSLAVDGVKQSLAASSVTP